MDVFTGAGSRPHTPPRRTPQSCRWGESTLFLAYPEYLSAWDSPWSCGHPSHTRTLDATEMCDTCPEWAPRSGPHDREQTFDDPT
jgi:hypothetical protein